MDETRFDRLAREVVTAGSRRAFVRWVSAGLAGGVLAGRWRSTAAVGCPPGQHNPTHSRCEPCPVGAYSDTHGTEVCSPCKVGHYQPEMGKTSCKPCAAGSVQPKTGQATCNACPSGSMQAESGKTTCDTCPAGTAQPKAGSATCPACPEFATPPGSVSCDALPTCSKNAPRACPGRNGQPGVCCKRDRKCAYLSDGTAKCKKKGKH